MNWKYSPLCRKGIGASGAPLIERGQPITPRNGGYGSNKGYAEKWSATKTSQIKKRL